MSSLQSRTSPTARCLLCVHCGSEAPSLYQQVGQDIRLRQCVFCSQTVDHYIEFEILLVFIDMQLFCREVYRHVLHNRFSKQPEVLRREAWRFLLVCLLLDTHARWRSSQWSEHAVADGEQADESGILHWLQSHDGDWAALAVTLVEMATYLLVVSSVVLLVPSAKRSCSPAFGAGIWEAHLSIWEAVSVSSFGKLFTLVTMVWGGFAGGVGETINVAVGAFVAASNSVAVQTAVGDSDCGRALAAVVCGTVARGAVAMMVRRTHGLLA
eukprot:gb/GFBE01069428.1/.p1 GENE.gb/GFBE01069428.1/~~gb/GFBE01069428.1/.p1  ORF type:complete len:269 (+),score=32.81 gb/GFBE01069428.1/:1-807(+)